MYNRIDLNCDMGESYGACVVGNDPEIMPLISSANIACGFHGGDPGIIHQTIRLAQVHGVSVGAHPSYPDLQGFGRREMQLTPQEVYDGILYQIGAVEAFTRAAGVQMRHVKPHGALYNRAAKDDQMADAIIQAVYYFDNNLWVYGPPGSAMERAAHRIGLKFCREAFVDRTYQSDGSLTPRSNHGSLIHDTAQAIRQVEQILTSGQVTALDGSLVPIECDTFCIHGDGQHAVTFAKALQGSLRSLGFNMQSPITEP
jgi:UPF0271 protein